MATVPCSTNSSLSIPLLWMSRSTLGMRVRTFIGQERKRWVIEGGSGAYANRKGTNGGLDRVLLKHYKQMRLLSSRYIARNPSVRMPFISRNEVPWGSRSAREGGQGREGASYLGNAGNHVGTDPGHVAVAIHLP